MDGPERCSISDPCKLGHRPLSPIYLDLLFLARQQFLLLVDSDFGSIHLEPFSALQSKATFSRKLL
jgi:hypothetical protein